MKVLLLSPYPDRIKSILHAHGDRLDVHDSALGTTLTAADTYGWIVCYGYRHLIRDPVLTLYDRRIINLHISYLPWNRGADPNFWSWFDRTPKGVSIHLIDRGIDTGDIIAQKRVSFSDHETLSSSYAQLLSELEDLFQQVWPQLRCGAIQPIPQSDAGTSHRLMDKEPFVQDVDDLWSLPVATIEEWGSNARRRGWSPPG